MPALSAKFLLPVSYFRIDHLAKILSWKSGDQNVTHAPQFFLLTFRERNGWFVWNITGDMEEFNGQENNSNGPENSQQETVNIVSNMALAHELLMNDSFRLASELPENS